MGDGELVSCPATSPMRGPVGKSNGIESVSHQRRNDGALVPEVDRCPMVGARREFGGVITGNAAAEPAAVFAEAWPAWLPVLPALGYQCTSVYCGSEAGSHRRWFDEGVTGPWLAEQRASKCRFRLAGIRTAFISGSLDFVEKVTWRFPDVRFLATLHRDCR